MSPAPVPVLLSAGPVVPAPDDGRSCALLIKQPPLSPTASHSCDRGLSPASADPLAASGLPAVRCVIMTLRTSPRGGHHPGGVIAMRARRWPYVVAALPGYGPAHPGRVTPSARPVGEGGWPAPRWV